MSHTVEYVLLFAVALLFALRVGPMVDNAVNVANDLMRIETGVYFD